MSRRQLEQASLVGKNRQDHDIVYNPYFAARSPLKNQRGRYGEGCSPLGLSPSRSQGFNQQQQAKRKQSLKKGLFQIEIEKQNKENQHSNILTSHARTKPETNMFAKVIQGLSPRSSTPTRTQLIVGGTTPSMSSFIEGEKLSFKRISSQSRQSDGHRRQSSDRVEKQMLSQPLPPQPQAIEYQISTAIPPLLETSKHIHSTLQMSFAKQFSVEEPKLHNKQSLKTTTSTIEQPKTSSITPELARIVRGSHNDSLWSSSDRVNISQSDSITELNMSPYFN